MIIVIQRAVIHLLLDGGKTLRVAEEQTCALPRRTSIYSLLYSF